MGRVYIVLQVTAALGPGAVPFVQRSVTAAFAWIDPGTLARRLFQSAPGASVRARTLGMDIPNVPSEADLESLLSWLRSRDWIEHVTVPPHRQIAE